MKRRRKNSRPTALPASNPAAALSAYHLRLHHASPIEPTNAPSAGANPIDAPSDAIAGRTFLGALFALAPAEDDLRDATSAAGDSKPPAVKRRRRAIHFELCSDEGRPPSAAEDDLCIAEAGFAFADLVQHGSLGACSLVLREQEGEGGDAEVELRIRRRDEDRFIGPAEHWLGASVEELLALQSLIQAKMVSVRARLQRGSGHGALTEVRISYWINAMVLEESTRDDVERPPRIAKSLCAVMEWVYPGSVSRHVCKPSSPSSFAAVDLFARIKPSPSAPMIRQKDLPAGCLAELRPYQLRAVKWMVGREQQPNEQVEDLAAKSLWMPYHTCDLKTFYFNPFLSLVARQPVGQTQPVLGGILADEMGLGKTVEVLALILANPAPPAKSIIRHVQAEDEPTPEGEAMDVSCACKLTETLPGGFIQCASCRLWQHLLCSCVPEGIEVESYKHVCTVCRAREKPISSRATLIVCPATIVSQWHSEIYKHTTPDFVKCVVYEGVKKSAEMLHKCALRLLRRPSDATRVAAVRKTASLLSVDFLSKQDIVLTTYEALRLDLHHLSSATRQMGASRFSFREKKRYRSVPTPLTQMKLWRVCLDEAQEVESSTAKAAEMALQLSAVNRWCVTGTPVGARGLEDLYGLVLFLQRAPFYNKWLWTRALAVNGLDRLALLFRGLLWRNTKADVREELNLPQRHEHIHLLSFTAIERHFYNQQYEQAVTAARQVNRSLDLLAFLRLRACCNHPQVGAFGLKRVKPEKKERGADSAPAPMTLAEIQSQLVQKARLECEEAQRIHVMTLNGVAGIFLLQGEVTEAEQTYIHALDLMDSNEREGFFRGDPLQKLHAIEGLTACIQPEDAAPTRLLFRDKLRRQAADIRRNYMKRWESNVSYAHEQYRQTFATTEREMDAENAVLTLLQKGKGKRGVRISSWWAMAIKALPRRNQELLVERMQASKAHGGAGLTSQVNFSSVAGLAHVLEQHLTKMANCRLDVSEMVARIVKPPTAREVAESSDCRVCRAYFGKQGPMCHHCKAEKVLVALEMSLFSFRESRGTRQEQLEQMNALRNADPALALDQMSRRVAKKGVGYAYREACLAHTLLKLLRSALKAVVDAPKEILRSAKLFFDRFDNMCKELYAARLIWSHKEYQLKQLDELAMATLRIRLQLPGEMVEEDEKQWKIAPAEVAARKELAESERVSTRFDLKQAQSQLRFLLSIDDKSSSVQEQKKCLLCLENILEQHDEIAVLTCGHSFCVPCIDRLKAIHRARGRTKIACPTCRQKSQRVEVGLTRVAPGSAAEKAKGEEKVEKEKQERLAAEEDFSTKIKGVVSLLMELEQKEPTMKAVVFSQWNQFLTMLEHALTASDISFVRMRTGNLRIFRNDPSIKCLLLPVKKGNKGLTLTEANHVIMVDPLVNPAVDLQAISRVHRISQTRDVHVHRFLIKETIEEKIHQLMKEKIASLVGPSERQEFEVSRAGEGESLSSQDIEKLFDLA